MGTRVEDVEVTLTDIEMQASGRELARLLSDEERLAEELSEVKSDFKARREAIRRDIAKMREEVNTGRRRAEVEVIDRYDGGARVVEVVRIDTGEVIRTRRARPDEEQGELYQVPNLEKSEKGKGRRRREKKAGGDDGE